MDNCADEEPVNSRVNYRSMRFGSLIIKSAILVLVLNTSSGAGADAPPSEYRIKAAFIYHFSQFVDWPQNTFAAPDSPFIIGVLGENPFGADLEQTIHGKSMGTHPLVVRFLGSSDEAATQCKMLFISSSMQKQFPRIMAGLAASGTLTVGESDKFNESGGMIQFVMEGTKIRFRINEDAAQQAGLKISAKLLSLAIHAQK